MRSPITKTCFMKKILLTLLAAAFCAAGFSQKPAVVANDKSGWHKIAQNKVDLTTDHDEVAVMGADRFAMLKFKVTNAPIEISDIDVYFEEGDMQNIRVGYAVKKDGAESRPIDLRGGSERNLKKIVFRYKTVDKGTGNKGTLEIWGKKTNTAQASGKPVREGASEAKKDVKEAGKEMKKEAKEIKRETKKEAKEAKNDMKEEMD